MLFSASEYFDGISIYFCNLYFTAVISYIRVGFFWPSFITFLFLFM